MNMVWEFFKRIAPGLILALCIVAGLWGAYRFGVKSTTVSLTMSHNLVIAERDAAVAKAMADQVQQKADMERKRVEDMDALANDFQRKEDDAKREIDRLADAVRAGDVRLRDRFTCPAVPTSGSAQAGTSAARGDASEARGLRGEDASALVRDADEADAVVRQLTACQAIVRKDRGQ